VTKSHPVTDETEEVRQLERRIVALEATHAVLSQWIASIAARTSSPESENGGRDDEPTAPGDAEAETSGSA
jgi:hypothetical protein